MYLGEILRCAGCVDLNTIFCVQALHPNMWTLVYLLLLAWAAAAVALGAFAVHLRKSADKETRTEAHAALRDTLAFYGALWHYLVRGGSLDDCPHFSEPDDRHARVQVFSLALVFRLWSLPHYRNGTFQEDMRKNLRNVALPGTGVPLSVFAAARPLALFFLLVLYPAAAAASAAHRARVDAERSRYKSATAAFFAFYAQQLVRPQDWFSFWRLNCRVATAHALASGDEGYALEDKLAFIRAAEAAKVPTTPVLAHRAIVCKHRNEEGGMGFQAFSNAVAGGDWIIQERLSNSEFLAGMLPANAPLSTFRVISGSTLGAKTLEGLQDARPPLDAPRGGPAAAASPPPDGVAALSCVWRAGRAGAATDHDSILFDVDMASGEIRGGTSNAHWYRLWSKALSTKWLSTHGAQTHPDTGRRISGTKVPRFREDVLDVVVDAHRRLAPNVPLIGWDVALTEEHGPVLLEGNFSCNFFRGTFDQSKYFLMVERYLRVLEAPVRRAGEAGEGKKSA
jgi:hypothetical protein